MRQGDYAKLLLTKSGNLLAFSTGSDACAEHECGSRPMLEALCNQMETNEEVVRELKRRFDGRKTLKERLFGVQDMVYPDILESKRITKKPNGLVFMVKDGEVPEAILGYSRHAISWDNPELSFREFISRFGDKDAIGAWDEQSFAIRVRGKRYVKALRAFYEDMQAGHVVFGGMFMKSRDLSGGVILANSKYFGEDIKASIQEAQKESESSVRLKALDHSRAIMREMHKLGGGVGGGHVWPIWKDKEESDVVYGLNPSYGQKANYYGPYTEQELLDWAAAGYAYHLGRKAA